MQIAKELVWFKIGPNSVYKKFDGFMHEIEFSRCHADYCCYVKKYDNNFIIVLFYIDDILIADSCTQQMNKLKDQSSSKF